MKKVKILQIILCVFILLGVTGCATTINLNVTRPAELNLESVGSIAVLPFGTTSTNRRSYNNGRYSVVDFFIDLFTDEPEQREVADYLHTNLEREFINSPYLTLMNSDAVRNAVNRGNDSPADVYLVGRITRFDSNLKTETVKEKDDDKTIIKDYFYREVYFTFEYQVVDGCTSAVMYSDSYFFSEKSSKYERFYDVPSEKSMLRYDLDSIVSSISKKVQPYNVVKSIKLLKDKSKDPEMERANTLAKNGLIDESIDLYTDIYKDKKYYEAGYNIAALLEAQGNFDEALDIARNVSLVYPDKKIFNLISDIAYEISMKKKLENQNFSLK